MPDGPQVLIELSLDDSIMHFGYRACLADFVTANPSAIVGCLHQFVADDGFQHFWSAQTSAWMQEIAILQRVSGLLIATTEYAGSWTLLLEYEIARRGRRMDAVLLLSTAIVVLEFKIGLQSSDSASRWQVYEYALDLRDFHSASENIPIAPLLVLTGCSDGEPIVPITLGDNSASRVYEVIEVGPAGLAPAILALNDRVCEPRLASFAHDSWCTATYRPSLNIIEAAERVFAGHQVREISHATAMNLSNTVDAVIRCVADAERNHQRVVCFVTGVPGAGKTLAGLSAVHDPTLRSGGKPAAVFLSGNGPLVKIVRAALIRDLKRRDPGANDVEREVATFIQNVHSFLGYYAFQAQQEQPPEHVVIFDEAQRAWNGKQMALKRRGDQSEASLVLDVMARCTEWSVIVALVGFGQEIHQGEAGLEEWGRAIAGRASVWSAVASPQVLETSLDEDGALLFPADVQPISEIRANPDLHLAVSIRSHRARMVSQWVKRVLDGNADAAAQLFAGKAEFPVVLTRSLTTAKEWLRAQSGEARHAGCMGLLASSGALRLRADGLEVSSAFRRGYPYHEWFLAESRDVRASSTLEVAATEFECQGLEVDWAAVCWGGDLIFDRPRGNWDTRRFVGSRWVSASSAATRQYILNKYRVLLTRARRGLAVWVPPGSTTDSTRKPDHLDATAEFLLRCGIVEMRV